MASHVLLLMPVGMPIADSSSTTMVITDAPRYAASLVDALAAGGVAGAASATAPEGADPAASRLAEAFFARGADVFTSSPGIPSWRHLVVSEFAPCSQYERLIDLARERTPLPDRLACIARTGRGFHGFHGRSWVARPGNIHLTVHLAPARPIPRFETVFMALAAVSVVETIDTVPGLEGCAGIRWVNDVLLEEKKVAGVLAYTQSRGDRVTSVILGIGLNVESVPDVPPTAFVPGVAAVRSFAADPVAVRVEVVLGTLLRSIERNYQLLLQDGFGPLVDHYRARSVVIGRQVLVSRDEPDELPRIIASGRVRAIGDDLALHLTDVNRPVTSGRLILPAPADRPLRHHPTIELEGVS